MKFNERAVSDLAAFFNAFAEEHCIVLDGASHEISAIVETTMTGKTPKNYDGVFISSTIVMIKASDIPTLPVRGTLLVLDDVTYLVAGSSTEMGLHVIDLEVADA